MVACMTCSCSPDALPRTTTPFPSPTFTRRLRSQEVALALLQRCSDFKQLKQVHSHIIRNGPSCDQKLATKLLCLCSSYGKMDYATLVFRQMQNPLSFAWNIMIRGHTLNGDSHKALLLYKLMIFQCVAPDKFTFPFVIKACIASSAIDKGREVHVMAIKTGFAGDVFVQNTLMDLYLKCGGLVDGRKVFHKMRVRNVVSWTTMLTGLIVHEELDAARQFFEQMPIRNVVSWTAMINGYVRNQRPHEAFELFRRMQHDNVRPNEFTLVSLLTACAELGSLNLGSWIHDFALKNGFKLGAFLGTALIDMYSKCGSLEDARDVFDKMQTKSLATWNSMISSLGVHGCGEEALALFAQMESANVQPDAITFVGVLCACVHTGNVGAGVKYFKDMSEHYSITPIPEHYTCMIELSNRANMLDELSELAVVMPVKPSHCVTASMLRDSKVYSVAGAYRGISFGNSSGELHWLGGSLCLSPKFPSRCTKLDVR
ncbi:pentatricopeptide repeat-containing protein At3g26630, chloroplastic [Malania oleifera]|uniref:pentatricopeptide repeat-containing protein At3g26630, chloroplastic n=1 Tax=Malania oleifera TaxID=397392 RepID=UPI0025ADF084|nr:pentatricopeptide repeat-containing protein At3g26630, chloroplastic [Malania oleifera]